MSETKIVYESIKDWFAEAFENRKADPIENVLVLTYEFDDQQLLNLVAGRSLDEDYQLKMNQLKVVAKLRPVVIYDSRKTREFNGLPHFLELFPVHNKGFSCHHSKAYLVVTSKRVQLIIGSCNLTKNGLFTNREVYSSFQWSESESANYIVLTSFSLLLENEYAAALSSDANGAIMQVIENIRTKTSVWNFTTKKPNAEEFLLSSGYQGLPGGLQQLKTYWENRKLVKVFAVSPFFDQGGHQYIIDDIVETFGVPQEVEIVTDCNFSKKVSKRHFGKRVEKVVLRIIPDRTSPAEKARIQKANNNQSVKELALQRALHAKILLLIGEKDSLLYQGSANFTRKAWMGANRELGTITWIKNGEGFAREICKQLNIESTNIYDRLSDELSFEELQPGDEEVVPDASFPSFVERVVLYSKSDAAEVKQVYFRFYSENAEEFKQYNIYWGRTHVDISSNCSQMILQKDFFANLVGNRNLRFVLKTDSTKFYYLPYIYSESIELEKESIVFPDSEDWLDFYLGYQEESPLDSGEYIPGEGNPPGGTKEENVLGIDREANVVINMQHYLDKFSRVEGQFTTMSKNIAQMKEGRDRALAESISKPLITLSKILEREWKNGNCRDDSTFLFKMGELILLLKRVSDYLPEVLAEVSKFTLLLPRERFTKEKAYQLYLNHVLAKGVR